ncbi:uncharacterized protein BDR25DRAFT_357034 [Lindgomyces ingoldianus]|uniref:Uncharacterized protein n=1 Tax=Lindgomyces ingoldianus TaxID=673940 RepID=A0ACB6QP33_9PLEO|nr:uncharacterized protein BDR25DRAFT_357034 [Lindgomyces ingoldianus]KAF2468676.1 hypothetical protein BDR25DRAFT_357034 [Lindgomyces ingoldianus]
MVGNAYTYRQLPLQLCMDFTSTQGSTCHVSQWLSVDLRKPSLTRQFMLLAVVHYLSPSGSYENDLAQEPRNLYATFRTSLFHPTLRCLLQQTSRLCVHACIRSACLLIDPCCNTLTFHSLSSRGTELKCGILAILALFVRPLEAWVFPIPHLTFTASSKRLTLSPPSPLISFLAPAIMISLTLFFMLISWDKPAHQLSPLYSSPAGVRQLRIPASFMPLPWWQSRCVFMAHLLMLGLVTITWTCSSYHFVNATSKHQSHIFVIFAAGQPVWGVANTAVKFSTLHLPIAVFPSQTFRKACYGTMVVSVSHFASAFLKTFLKCKPEALNNCIGSFWNNKFGHQCLRCYLPMPMLWQLRLPLGKKVELSRPKGVQLMVLSICVITLLRVVYLAQMDLNIFTYASPNLATYHASCVLPTPLFKTSRYTISQSKLSNQSNFHRLGDPMDQLCPLNTINLVNNPDHGQALGTITGSDKTNRNHLQLSQGAIRMATTWNFHKVHRYRFERAEHPSKTFLNESELGSYLQSILSNLIGLVVVSLPALVQWPHQSEIFCQGHDIVFLSFLAGWGKSLLKYAEI